MSKTLIRTDERIVSKALEMFNERGIEYVGLRELAATLKMRVGNITYYFPTKDELVNRLSLDFSELNSMVMVNSNDITLRSFLEMLHIVFNNHVHLPVPPVKFCSLDGTEQSYRVTVQKNPRRQKFHP